MNDPKRIYLQPDEYPDQDAAPHEGRTWAETDISGRDTEYVRADLYDEVVGILELKTKDLDHLQGQIDSLDAIVHEIDNDSGTVAEAIALIRKLNEERDRLQEIAKQCPKTNDGKCMVPDGMYSALVVDPYAEEEDPMVMYVVWWASGQRDGEACEFLSLEPDHPLEDFDVLSVYSTREAAEQARKDGSK